MSAPQTSSPGDDEIDLSELLGILIDHKWWIVTITGVFFLAALAYAVLATPIYQANAVVQVEQKVPDLPGLSDISQTLGASSSEATTEIALITSRAVLGKAIAALNLNIKVTPWHAPLIGDFVARRYRPEQPGAVAEPVLGLARYDWGGAQLEVFQLEVPRELQDKSLTLIAGTQGAYTLFDDQGNLLLAGQTGQPAHGHGVTMQVETLRANPGTRFDVIRYRKAATFSRLKQHIQANEQGEDSGIIELTYQSADPVLAKQLLDQVSQAYVRQNVDRNSAEAAKSLAFVRDQLPKLRTTLDAAEAALNAFRAKSHSVDITLQTKGLLDQELAVEASIQQLRMQQADIARLYTPAHPAYEALMTQIERLQAKKAGMEKQVGNLPDTQQQLLRLTRDFQITNETYTGLLNQAQQLDIARAGNVGNVRIVDSALVDTALPVKPKKAVIVLGGTFLGGFLAVALVFIRKMLDRGVEDPTVIEELGLPVYASIPVSLAELQDAEKIAHAADTSRKFARRDRRKHARADRRQHLLVVSAPADLATEAIRSLRTSLHFARMEAKNNVLMISGCSPKAGKTFISANLAAVVAQSGQRVMLIDGDMRKGAVHKVVGGKAENGLSDLISGQATLEQVTRPVAGVEGLDFIARGKVPPNPSELLMNPRFSALLAQLQPLYDLVIIDTPPVLAVTDGVVIGQQAGTSLLVVRFGLNQAREIALAKKRFEQNRVEIKGAIFNAVERRSAGYYTYGYYEYESAPA